MNMQNFFLPLLGLLVLQRLIELGISKRNEKALLTEGAKEICASHYPLMVAIHSLWLMSCALEWFYFPQTVNDITALFCLAVFLLGQTLRITAIATLRQRWTTKVFILPQTPPVAGGIFKYIRHPNYLGVILEFTFFPLIAGLWRTALWGSLANAFVLFIRIKAEEKGLEEIGNHYLENFANKKRFLIV